MKTTTWFEFLDTDQIDKELARLVDRFNLQPQDEHSFRRYWLDTFDWQLYKQGKALGLDQSDDGYLAYLYDLESGDVLARQPLHSIPQFPSELLASRITQFITEEIPPRTWMIRSRQKIESQMWALVDDDQKTLVRVEYNAIKPLAHGSAEVAEEPIPVIGIRKLRGYEDSATPLLKKLNGRKALQAITGKIQIEKSLHSNGAVPGDYSSKFSLQLHRKQNTDSALRDILTALLHNLRVNVPGTIDDIDSEFLHDLRVATRRSRSAISRIKNVLPEAQMERFNEDLRWVGSITGACRDLDVYLLALPDFQKELPDDLSVHMEPFGQYLVERKEAEHAILVEHLQSERLTRFIDDWDAFLKQTPEMEQLSDIGGSDVAEIAGKATWKMYRRVISDGDKLTQDSPAEGFHDLRKDMKKLRYLMELFGSLYPQKVWKKELKLQKALQNILGDFQDLEVQAGNLLEIGRDLFTRDYCNAETLMALGTLATQLREKQKHSLDHFDEAFRDLSADETRETFKQLCKEQRKGDDA